MPEASPPSTARARPAPAAVGAPRQARVAARTGARRARPSVVAVVAAGGVLGTLGRYGVGLLAPVSPGRFPWGTFAVNVTGSFLLASLLVVLSAAARAHGHMRAFAATGVLGAYTTFSTLVVETDRLVHDGHAALGAAYLSASVGAGLLAAVCGLSCARSAARSVQRWRGR